MQRLEPRLLMSADLAPVPLEPVPLESESGQHVAVLAQSTDNAAASTTDSNESGLHALRRELVVVDTAATDFQHTLDALLAQTADGTDQDVVLLDAEREGLAQLTELLTFDHDLSAVHLIADADDGALRLAGRVLDASAVSTAVRSWSKVSSSVSCSRPSRSVSSRTTSRSVWSGTCASSASSVR